MKASELIKSLEYYIEMYGNIDVYVENYCDHCDELAYTNKDIVCAPFDGEIIDYYETDEKYIGVCIHNRTSWS